MKVLVLGGTGAMGAPLINQLLCLSHDVHVTSRAYHDDKDVTFYQGDAHDLSFLEHLLKSQYDVIVDFMSYSTREFQERVELLTSKTGQYVFISSARVYSESKDRIREDHDRILDVCDDKEYLKSDEYALSKARQENCLLQCKNKSWTIVRPSLTYNTERMQYAIGEKEEWLFRYLHNEPIIFPRNLLSTVTTMSYGADVSRAISLLVGKKEALGEVYNIAGAEPITWGKVNDIYFDVLKSRFRRSPQVVYVDDWQELGRDLGKYYQLKYARSVNRIFDNSKLESLIGKVKFVDPYNGLKRCLCDYLDGEYDFKRISWKTEAYYNRMIGIAGLMEEFSKKEKIKYLVARYSPIIQWKKNI